MEASTEPWLRATDPACPSVLQRRARDPIALEGDDLAYDDLSTARLIGRVDPATSFLLRGLPTKSFELGAAEADE